MTKASRLVSARERDWQNVEGHAKIVKIFAKVKKLPELCDNEIESFYSKRGSISRLQEFKAIKLGGLYFLFREIPSETDKNSEFKYEHSLHKRVFFSYCFKPWGLELKRSQSVSNKQGKAKIVTIFEYSHTYSEDPRDGSSSPIATYAVYFITEAGAQKLNKRNLGIGHIAKKYAIKFEDKIYFLLTPINFRSEPFVLKPA